MPFAIKERVVVVTPDGAPWAPRPRVDNAMVKALARAFRWRKMLDTGEYATPEDLARAKGAAPSYVSRILRLTLLAPDIVEASRRGRSIRPSDLLKGESVQTLLHRAMEWREAMWFKAVMAIATVKQLCTPNAVVTSDSLVEQVAQIEDFASGKVDGREFFRRNHFTEGLDLLVKRGFDRLAGKSEDGAFYLTQAMGELWLNLGDAA